MIRPTNIAVIRHASYGLHVARGYLLYWQTEGGSEWIDSWHIYKTITEARAEAAKKSPDARIIEGID